MYEECLQLIPFTLQVIVCPINMCVVYVMNNFLLYQSNE